MRVMKVERRRPYAWDGGRIKALREHLGLTQTAMAARLGTRQQTISEWENGMYRPRGASATLLSIVADGSKFRYDPLERTGDQPG
jgi:DNA-binding transcriptional regulator YiaG